MKPWPIRLMRLMLAESLKLVFQRTVSPYSPILSFLGLATKILAVSAEVWPEGQLISLQRMNKHGPDTPYLRGAQDPHPRLYQLSKHAHSPFSLSQDNLLTSETQFRPIPRSSLHPKVNMGIYGPLHVSSLWHALSFPMDNHTCPCLFFFKV